MRILPAYQNSYNTEILHGIMNRLSCGELLARALIRRGVTKPDEAVEYVHPETCTPADYSELPDIEKACARIRKAVSDHERICVYGDYDADGICSTVILVRTLMRLGADVIWKLPSRQGDGYGLHEQAVYDILQQGAKLIVTVDNGITALKEVALAKKLGMDVIVTDHHTAGETIPDCCAVVCASRADASGNHRDLCGAGVALQISRFLLAGVKDWDLYALAAVATIADSVPLCQENRMIIAKGLPHISKNEAFREILSRAGWKGQELTEQQVAFLICPRLNASGRVSDASIAVTMLLSDDLSCIREIADKIEACNTLRRQLESEILSSASARIRPGGRSIILSDPEWNPGVTGIVAARLSERMHCPVILFSEKDGRMTGSGRSPGGIDLYQCIKACSDVCERFGGHTGAAGVMIRTENYACFQNLFEKTLTGFDESCFEPCCYYEESLAIEQVNIKVAQEYRMLAPFGMDNPEPVCLIKGVSVLSPVRMGRDGSHLAFYAKQDGGQIRVVAFGQGDYIENIRMNSSYDLLVKLNLNSYRGQKNLELICVGILESGSEMVC